MRNYDLTYEFIRLLPVFSKAHTGHTFALRNNSGSHWPWPWRTTSKTRSAWLQPRPCGTLISCLNFVTYVRSRYVGKQHTRVRFQSCPNNSRSHWPWPWWTTSKSKLPWRQPTDRAEHWSHHGRRQPRSWGGHYPGEGGQNILSTYIIRMSPCNKKYTLHVYSKK